MSLRVPGCVDDSGFLGVPGCIDDSGSLQRPTRWFPSLGSGHTGWLPMDARSFDDSGSLYVSSATIPPRILRSQIPGVSFCGVIDVSRSSPERNSGVTNTGLKI